MVDAVIKVEQIASGPGSSKVRDLLQQLSWTIKVRDTLASRSGTVLQGHLWAISNPMPTTGSGRPGWVTADPEQWSDSPTFQPLLLYRYRFGWGRDKVEFPFIGVGQPGQRLGNLDHSSGLLLWQRDFSKQSVGRVRDLRHSGYTIPESFVPSFSGKLMQMRDLDTSVTGDTTVEEFPFVLVAVPIPFSKKNPVTSDVFIRLSNFSTPIDPDTIKLFLDGVEKTVLEVVPFSGGLGGFDVTWNNDAPFDYGDQVDVVVEFYDTALPPNQIIIRYPFYTLFDLRKPYITNLSPANGAVDVGISGPLQFDVIDNEHSVDISTLRLYVNGRLVEDAFDGTLTTSLLETDNGYHVVFTPTVPWLYGDLIPVALFVKDTSVDENELFFSYSFTTLESSAPRLVDFYPEPCGLDVPVGKDVMVTIVDGGSGLQKDTIILTVEDIERDYLTKPVIYRET